jgi:hypothetical protein
MRIIILSIISWLVIVCIAIVVIFSVLTILKITKKAIEKIGVSRKEFVISLVISAIVIIILSISVREYFVLKSPADRISGNKLSQVPPPPQKEEQIKENQSQPEIKEQVLMGTSTEKDESSVAVAPEETVLRSEKEEPKEKKQKKLLQPLKSSKAIFTVQVGSFADLSHAKALKMRIRNDGYDAFIAPATLKKGKVYKVCAGKFIERKEAETLSEKIRNAEGLQTFITSLQP